MAARRWWTMQLCLVCMVITAQERVVFGEVSVLLKAEGLTEVPKGSTMRNDATHVYLGENKISKIKGNAFQSLKKLEALFMKGNVLETIAIHAFYGTSLEILKLEDNLLTRVPDLDDIRDTVFSIDLSRNLIDVLYGADLEGLSNLRNFVLSENPLTSVIDLVSLPPSFEILDLTLIEFVCCRSMYFLKNLHSNMLLIDAAPCVYPVALVGEPWGNIAESQLEHQTCGNVVYRCFSYSWNTRHVVML